MKIVSKLNNIMLTLMRRKNYFRLKGLNNKTYES